MGDRGNIVIGFPEKYGGGTVYLYSQDTGSKLPALLAEALDSPQARRRYDDPAYLTRIVFGFMLDGADPTDEYGYGISPTLDNGRTNLYVDVETRRVDGVPFAEFIAKNGPNP